jgi:hypothetical protein
VAALSSWHEHHEAAAEALAGVAELPAHVMLEAYSVLTRLPAGLAVDAGTASAVLVARFPEPPLTLAAAERTALISTLARAGVVGGASYDGLVALEAAAHDRPLLTLDRRGVETYQRLGAAHRIIAG